MDTEKYLQRIGYDGPVEPDDRTLAALHERHIFQVPFENIDIHYKRLFDLTLSNIFQKVVVNRRGGFCYELNYLFGELLRSLGFQTRIISARIFTERGEPGPQHDHMCLYIQTDRSYLVDVGFGDLFIRPLEIRDGIQTDGRSSFRIEPFASGQYLLSTITPDGATERKYTFSLQEEPAEVFQALCYDKQTNPESYFVKNTICTKATPTGRITIFNDKLIERYGDERMVVAIENDLVLRQVLEKRFEITI